MSKAIIIRVWGKADNFEIEFTNTGGTAWECTVPPDLEDGQYAVEINAMNEHGETAYWTGILFMLQGTPCLHIKPPKYLIWLKPQRYEIIMKERCCYCGE